MSKVGAGKQAGKAVDPLQVAIAELRESRKRVAEAAVADRRVIERALHDGVQQSLVALAVDLQRLAALVDTDPAAVKSLLQDITATVREALDEATALATWVYPALLGGRGLASALRSAADSAGVTIDVNVPARVGYPPEITAAVYWSCVEALSSASRGSNVTITMLDADAGLSFEVVVDGYHSGERLARLRDRIEGLDGRLSVDDGHDGGSRVQGWLPLSG